MERGTPNSNLSSFGLWSYSASNQKVEKGRHKGHQSHWKYFYFLLLSGDLSCGVLYRSLLGVLWPVSCSVSVCWSKECGFAICLKMEYFFLPFPFWPHTSPASRKSVVSVIIARLCNQINIIFQKASSGRAEQWWCRWLVVSLDVFSTHIQTEGAGDSISRC